MTRPLTIVRIIDRLNVGGPALHVVLTAARLQPGFRTVLLYGDIEPGEGDMSYLLARHGVAAVKVPGLSRDLRPLRDLQALAFLCRLMWRERPRVVCTHKTKAGLLGRVAALLTGVPVRVHTYHGHVLEGYFGPARTWAMIAMERALALCTTRLITVSERLAQELSGKLRIAPKARFAVVPLGLDLGPFRRADGLRGALRAELGLQPDEPLIGVVGRMVPIKDHLTFLRALPAVFAACPRARAVLVGGGELFDEIRAEIRRLGEEVAGRVHLLGWRDDLPRIYADLDVLALTSRNEGTPVAVIEALAAGVRVVATAVGGVPDVLQPRGPGGAPGGGIQRGTLIPPGDPAALAAALIDAVRAGQTPRSSDAARDEVCAAYGIERLCRDLSALYLSELAARGLAGAAPGGHDDDVGRGLPVAVDRDRAGTLRYTSL
jgi:glycosyltransferase involved in cell wall biosynthesis